MNINDNIFTMTIQKPKSNLPERVHIIARQAGSNHTKTFTVYHANADEVIKKIKKLFTPN